jgi:drug/metabolite transporter (DMT)-like permease
VTATARPAPSDALAPGPSRPAAGQPAPASRARLVLAFAIVYVVWGSTYLAMRVALEGFAPLLLGGARFLVAGALLGAWVLVRERPAWPDRRAWAWAAASGLLLLGCGNLSILLAEQRIPSGVTALLAATVALWMVLLEWARPGGTPPTARVVLGLLLGLGGVAVLVGPGELAGSRRIDVLGALFALAGSAAWAAGSLLSRWGARPASPMLGSAMQMLCGGTALMAGALVRGDVVHAPAPGMRALGALAYLVVFGSLVGFTAYIWLMQHAAPAKVATYAYVNPVVAVLLGWAFAGEAVGVRTVLAAGVIIGAVALISVGRQTR